uniref:Uncharacterized protein n=1 Tax=Tetranychus urticae TaxID=32264 RepID=T1L3R4_TETUR
MKSISYSYSVYLIFSYRYTKFQKDTEKVFINNTLTALVLVLLVFFHPILIVS